MVDRFKWGGQGIERDLQGPNSLGRVGLKMQGLERLVYRM